MKTYITMGLVYDTIICNKNRTCLHKIIIGETIEELKEILTKETKLTGINLRLEEVETW